MTNIINMTSWLPSLWLSHHHLQKQLLEQIGKSPDTDSKRWLILGYLNELALLMKKSTLVIVILLGKIILITPLTMKVLLI